jgi:O-antigen/teichoic acid export membrane protein
MRARSGRGGQTVPLYWPSDMSSPLVWRRSSTAVGIYVGSALGVLATIVAARVLGLEDFGIFATVLATAAFFQMLFDLTVEEALTKFGFRYIAAEDWGRFHRLFRAALAFKLLGGVLGSAIMLALAPFADSIFGAEGLAGPMRAAAALPLVQAPENVAATAMLLRGRYDIRSVMLAVSMGLRLAAVVVAAPYGVTQAIVGIVVAQVVATLAVGSVGITALRRFPRAPSVRLGGDRDVVRSFVVRSTAATGMLSFRATLTPVLLGIVSTPVQVGLLRVAQAPQSGLTIASSPARLILLTEQTRDWERGRRTHVLAGVGRYMRWAVGIAAVAVPVLVLIMPVLVALVFGDDYSGAVAAARIVLVAAGIHLVLGWTKSLPVTIGRPGLRILTHGIETVVLIPLVVVLGREWGVTGAAVAILVSAVAFAIAWAAVLVRLRAEVARGEAELPREGVLTP